MRRAFETGCLFFAVVAVAVALNHLGLETAAAAVALGGGFLLGCR